MLAPTLEDMGRRAPPPRPRFHRHCPLLFCFELFTMHYVYGCLSFQCVFTYLLHFVSTFMISSLNHSHYQYFHGSLAV